MKPEELAFQMAKAKWDNDNGDKWKSWDELDKDYQEIWIEDMRVVLRVVLKHIQEGEVVSVKAEYMGENIILQPDFQKFMEEKV